MEEKISKECLQYFVDGLNCHYNSDFMIKEEEDGLIVFDNSEKNFDSTKSLHLKFVKNDNEFSISLINYEKNDSILKNIYKNSDFFNPIMIIEGTQKLVSIFTEDDINISISSLSVEAISILIKYIRKIKC